LGKKEKRKKHEKRIKKALGRKRRAEVQPRAPGAATVASLPASLPRTPPNSFTVSYADPEALMVGGPLVAASWSVPPAKVALLLKLGRVVPGVVNGHMLVDTGARGNCMALNVATNDLGLTPVGFQETYGAHGKQKNLVFEAQLTLSIRDSFGSQTTLQSVQRVIGVPELDKLFLTAGVSLGNQPLRLIGLIGREFLRHATLIYKGGSASFEVAIDMASIAPHP
jgi:hypothetical protein